MALMPSGTYAGKLIDVKVGESKTGTQQIVLQWSVYSQLNEDTNQWSPLPDSIERSTPLYLSKSAMEWSFKKLQKIGFKGRLSAPKIEDFDPSTYQDGIVLECQHEKQESGKVYEKWEPQCFGGAPVVNPLPENEANVLDSLWDNFQSGVKK